MKKLKITLIIICLFLISGCDGEVVETASTSSATENVFFSAGGDVILIDSTIGNNYAYIEDSLTVRTENREAGIGFLVDDSVTVSSGTVSVSGTTVSLGGSIDADVYTTSSETYYAFTYNSTDYLTDAVGMKIESDNEMTSLALEWEDISSEQLYLGIEEISATSIYYAEDSQGTSYYMIVGFSI